MIRLRLRTTSGMVINFFIMIRLRLRTTLEIANSTRQIVTIFHTLSTRSLKKFFYLKRISFWLSYFSKIFSVNAVLYCSNYWKKKFQRTSCFWPVIRRIQIQSSHWCRCYDSKKTKITLYVITINNFLGDAIKNTTCVFLGCFFISKSSKHSSSQHKRLNKHKRHSWYKSYKRYSYLLQILLATILLVSFVAKMSLSEERNDTSDSEEMGNTNEYVKGAGAKETAPRALLN